MEIGLGAGSSSPGLLKMNRWPSGVTSQGGGPGRTTRAGRAARTTTIVCVSDKLTAHTDASYAVRTRMTLMRKAVPFVVVVALAVTGSAQGPASLDARLEAQLKQLFSAATFSPKINEPPHFKAFLNDPGSGTSSLAGVAFWTTEIEPLERGYDGPIKILVGMDTQGMLTGVIVAQHHEPYGDFSIETPQFAAQFTGKSVRDPFRVGADIDAVSRATISISSAARAIRNSARRMATQLLVPPK